MGVGWVWSSPPRGGTARGLGRGAQAKPNTRALHGPHICRPHIYGPHIYGPHIPGPHIHGPHIHGPHIYGPHIYSAAGPKHRLEAGGPKPRSEVWLLLARTSKTTHKGNGPKQQKHRTNLPTRGLGPGFGTSGPKPRSEVSLLLACTSKTTHKGTGPKLLIPNRIPTSPILPS